MRLVGKNNVPKRRQANTQAQRETEMEASEGKLLNKEREALRELPKQIEQMEKDRDLITSSMQEPDYYRNTDTIPWRIRKTGTTGKRNT